jgi:hydroxyacylglutathione hydrolase
MDEFHAGQRTLRRMIVERSMSQDWLSNTYLVAAGPGGDAFLVDAGGPVEPLIAKADEHGLTVTHVLLTHHHHDHVAELGAVLERWPDATVLAHPEERVPGTTGELKPDEEIEIGGLTVRALHTPGHTAGMLSLLVDGNVFTGDTLFKGSVGGVRAPGSTSYEDLKRSIMDVLLQLPGDTTIRPGHTDPTSVAEELESNRFVRIWRGVDPEGSEQCTALGEPATLILLGDDYDGGYKAWVRWPDGRDDIVPGSKVSR